MGSHHTKPARVVIKFVRWRASEQYFNHRDHCTSPTLRSDNIHVNTRAVVCGQSRRWSSDSTPDHPYESPETEKEHRADRKLMHRSHASRCSCIIFPWKSPGRSIYSRRCGGGPLAEYAPSIAKYTSTSPRSCWSEKGVRSAENMQVGPHKVTKSSSTRFGFLLLFWAKSNSTFSPFFGAKPTVSAVLARFAGQY